MRRLGRVGAAGTDERAPRTPATAWVPSADIFAHGHDLVIRLDLAGVAPVDISVTFAGGDVRVAVGQSAHARIVPPGANVRARGRPRR